MCTLLFRHQPGDTYPLAILSNRDEFYNRPAEGWAWRGDSHRFFAPLDQQAGGTWIGFSGRGVVAALTNIFPGRRNANFHSRGKLVTEALNLTTAEQAPALLQAMVSTHPFNNFNLLAADRSRAFLFTYHKGNLVQRELAPGVYEVANHPFSGRMSPNSDTTNETWLEQHEAHLLEHPLICKHGAGYGTRCSHKLLIHGRDPRQSKVWHLEGHPCQGHYELVLGQD